jgi:tetratricopeptide (TPR) repeat protein
MSMRSMSDRRVIAMVAAVIGLAPAAARGTAVEHLYAEARLATAAGRPDVAAIRLGEALKQDDSPSLKRRALEAAIQGGDSRAAFRLAAEIPDDPPPGPIRPGGGGAALIALTRMVDAARRGHWDDYAAARARFAVGGGAALPAFSHILAAWEMAGRKQWDGALAQLDAPETANAGPSASYVAEHRAWILASAGHWPEAATALRGIVATQGGDVPRLRLAAAAATLEAAGRNPEARATGVALLAGGPEREPMLDAARAKLRADPAIAGRKLGGWIRTPADGLAQLLVRAAADLGRQQVVAPALSFARLATFAGPKLPETWLLTADLLGAARAWDEALTVLSELEKRHPSYHAMAEVRRAAIFGAQQRYDEAIAVLAALAAKPDAGAEEWSALGEMERRAERLAPAREHFGRALAVIPAAAPPERKAILWFLRGSIAEQAGDWAAAEPDLRQAVALDPDNPTYLNYLGYSLLDRRLRQAEATALIEKAYRHAPESGAIIDSLGWAAYLAGDVGRAIVLLEQAWAAEPADPTIPDHLGDALWTAGRRIEARHAWAAALAQDPAPKLREALLRKPVFGPQAGAGRGG